MAQSTKPLKKKPVLCRVRGRNIFFYGKAARLIERAIKVSGLTPQQFLSQAIKNSIAYHKLEGKLK